MFPERRTPSDPGWQDRLGRRDDPRAGQRDAQGGTLALGDSGRARRRRLRGDGGGTISGPQYAMLVVPTDTGVQATVERAGLTVDGAYLNVTGDGTFARGRARSRSRRRLGRERCRRDLDGKRALADRRWRRCRPSASDLGLRGLRRAAHDHRHDRRPGSPGRRRRRDPARRRRDARQAGRDDQRPRHRRTHRHREDPRRSRAS